MLLTFVRIAARLLVAMTVLMLSSGCVMRPEQSIQRPDLYVGQGVGGCIGFYVLDGVVTGGFVLPSRLNLDDSIAWRLSREQRRVLGRTEAWPICRVTHLGDGAYRVVAFGGKRMSLTTFRLVVTELDDTALFYRLAPSENDAEIAYSGTAINVDAISSELEGLQEGGK